MSTQRISLFLILVLLFAAAAWLTIDQLLAPPETPATPAADSVAGAPASADREPGAGRPPVPPPDLRAMTQAAQTSPPPLSDEPEDDAAIEAEQFATAREQLASTDPEQRVEAAEQLGAYPTAEAEALLAQTLASDPSAMVRSAAAMSLGYVEKPTDQTIGTLMTALEDQDEDVRANALSTLEDFLTASDSSSSLYQRILDGLKTKAGSQSVPKDTRDSIRDIVADQTSASE